MVFQKAGIATSVINLVEKAVKHRENIPTTERLQSLSKIVKVLSRAVKIKPDLFAQGLDRFPYRIKVYREMKKNGIRPVYMKNRELTGWNFFQGKFYPPHSLTWLAHPFSDEFSAEITYNDFYRGANIITGTAYKHPSYCWKELSKIPHHGLYDCFGQCSEKNSLYNCEQAIYRALEGIVDSVKAQAVNFNNWHRFPEGVPYDRSKTKKPGLKEGIEIDPGPGKKKNNKNKKIRRRANRRPRTDNRITVNLSRHGAPFPPTVSDKVLWVHSGEIATGAASFNLQQFRINSLNDPSDTAGTTQPSGYTRLMNIYAIYRVLWVGVHLEIISREPDTEMIVGFGFSDTQPSTVLTSYDRVDSFYENSLLTRSATVGWGTGSSSKYIFPRRGYYWRMPLQKVIGNRGNVRYDNTFQAALGADPSNTIWGVITVQNMTNGVTIPNGISYRLTVEFEALFTSLRPDQEIFRAPPIEDKSAKIEELLEQVKKLQSS